MKTILFLVSFISLQVSAQHINWVKRSYNQMLTYGTGSQGAIFNSSGSFFWMNSNSATSQIDTGIIFQGTQSNNTVVSYVNADGIIENQFNMEGVGNWSGSFHNNSLNDSEVIFLAPTNNVYINGVKKMDSLVFHNTFKAISLCKLSKTGGFSSIINMPIYPSGNIKYGSQIGQNHALSVSFDAVHQRAYLLFNCSELVDTAVYDSNYVKPNTATVFQVNLLTGAIDKHWTFPAEFDGIGYVGDDIILSGRSQGNNYSYTIDSTVYSRDSSADLNTNDVLVASFNTNTNVYNWHHMYKIKSPNSRTNWVNSYSVDNTVYVEIRHQDTVTINGVLYGSLIPFNTQEYDMVMAFNSSGIKWINDFKGGNVQSIYKATNQPSGISYSVYTYSNLYINAIPVNKTIVNGNNYVAVTETGAIDKSFNAGFAGTKNKGDIFGVNYADSTLIVGIELVNTDSLLIGGSYYTKKHKIVPPYYTENLLYSFKSSAGDAPTGLKNITSTEDRLISVYPNPATTQLWLSGIDEKQPTQVSVYDITGKQLIAKTQLTENAIDISALSKGIYFLTIQTNTSNHTVKFVVN